MKIITADIAPLINKRVNKDDIIPEHVLNGSDDINNDVIPPILDNNALKLLRYSSIFHLKCLKAKAVDVTRNGWIAVSTADTAQESNKILLESLFNDYDNIEALYRMVLDYYTYTHAAVEILVNKKDEFKGFKHIRATTLQMMKGGEHAVQKVGNQTVYYKVCGKRPGEDLNYKTGQWGDVAVEDCATEILWFNGPSPTSDYYHEPDYLPAITTILSEEYLREYNNNGFITNGVPNYLITVIGDFDEEEDPNTGRTFYDDLEEGFRNLHNTPGTAIVVPIKTSDPSANIKLGVERISDELKEASFEGFRESNMNEILAAHEVPPQRVGINPTGPLSGSISVEINQQYANKVISPDQNMVETTINKLIVMGIMGIDDYMIQAKRLDARDLKTEFNIGVEAVQNGALKPLELRQIITDLFKLDNKPEGLDILIYHPELDEFYNNRSEPLDESTNQEKKIS